MSEYEHNEHLLDEIERLRESNFQLRQGAEEQRQRIKRLEEAGDGLLELCETEVNQHHLADQIDARCKSWRKAKEAKP